MSKTLGVLLLFNFFSLANRNYCKHLNVTQYFKWKNKRYLNIKKTVTKRGPTVIIRARKQAPEIVRLINLFGLNVTFTMGRLLKKKMVSRGSAY